MARGRMVSKVIATNSRLGEVSERAVLLYLFSLPHADRDGLLDGHPRAILDEYVPILALRHGWTETVVEESKRELLNVGLWSEWEDHDTGYPVVEIERFAEHQSGLQREAESKFNVGQKTAKMASDPRSLAGDFPGRALQPSPEGRGNIPGKGRGSRREREVEEEGEGEVPSPPDSLRESDDLPELELNRGPVAVKLAAHLNLPIQDARVQDLTFHALRARGGQAAMLEILAREKVRKERPGEAYLKKALSGLLRDKVEDELDKHEKTKKRAAPVLPQDRVFRDGRWLDEREDGAGMERIGDILKKQGGAA